MKLWKINLSDDSEYGPAIVIAKDEEDAIKKLNDWSVIPLEIESVEEVLGGVYYSME